MPWRKTGVKYSQNEIYLDIIEEVDAIVDRNGMVITSEVSGVIAANSRLSGVPDLMLAFVNPDLLDDCSFHPCVRYNRFERDKVVSFVPPDGAFELMRYRVNTHGSVSAPCYCQPSLSFDHSNFTGAIMITVGIKQQNTLIFPGARKTPLVVFFFFNLCVIIYRKTQVEEVIVVIPFSRNVRTTNLKVSHGSVLFDEATKVFPSIFSSHFNVYIYFRLQDGQLES
jgi:AP-3 complex subunit mu